jgi:hypothetical protein
MSSNAFAKIEREQSEASDYWNNIKREREETLFEQWLEAKEQERIAIETRRTIEDRMIAQFKISDQLDGAQTLCNDGYKVKVVGRINRKIDADKLQEIAAEHGLSSHLSCLFRWKPEVVAKAWEAADESITKPLTAAITATPGRPSFSITKEQ